MNRFPDFSSDFAGIERRIVIFPFKRKFELGDSDFDPMLLEKLSTEECMSALLNMALKGYEALANDQGFIQTSEGRKALSDFVNDNNNVLRWLNDCNIGEPQLLHDSIKHGFQGLYLDYCAYCIGINENPKMQKDFSRDICEKFGFETYTRRMGKDRVQWFRRKN
jgi:putative DNA primase/helicase